MTSNKLAIISNKMSTLNQNDPYWFRDTISEHEWAVVYFVESKKDIQRTITECATSQINIIAIDGGDGTAGMVFTELLNGNQYKELPTLAILPSGKTNMTANVWGIKGSRHKALSSLLKKINDKTIDQSIHTKPVLAINPGNNKIQYGTFLGAADVVEAIIYCRKHIYPLKLPNWISHILASSFFLKKTFSRTNSKFKINVTGKTDRDMLEWHDSGYFFLIMATTLPKLLLDLRPTTNSGSGSVSYIGLKTQQIISFSNISNILRGQIRPNKQCKVIKTKSLSICFSGRYTLDGEIYEASDKIPIEINGTKNLRFIK